jgi:hypothetical protein
LFMWADLSPSDLFMWADLSPSDLFMWYHIDKSLGALFNCTT